MSEPIDQFGYNKQLYQRPNQKWVCGHAEKGCPCRLGPDKNGRCATSHECEPVLKTKDGEKGRWLCTRPTAFGGKCEQGPYPDGTCCKSVPPCQPQLSVRGRRGVVNRWTISLTIGLLALAFGLPWRLSLFSPGPLTKHHQGASIASKNLGVSDTANNCSQCHAAAEMGSAGFVAMAFTGGADPTADSKRCQNCHDMGSHALDAHGVDPVRLASTTDASAPIACTVCHKEHHGAEFNITALSNDQCQSCHTEEFHSFAKGHPELADSGYPYDRRTRVIFDHQSHIDTHFKKDYGPGETVPNKCADCHVMDDASGFMQTRSFAQTCATCHNHTDQIAGSTATEPIPFIQLPGVDTASAKKAGVDLDYWPASRRTGSEGLTPFVQLLLEGGETPTLAADLAAVADLPRGFRDLRMATPAQLAAIDRTLKSVKVLMDELAAQEGIEVLQARLEKAIGRPLAHQELADLTAHFPQAALKTAHEAWFKSE